MPANQNRVWIELDRPEDQDEAAAIALGDERAALMTRLLVRLCEPGEAPTCKYRHRDHKGHYLGRFELAYGPMRVETLNDNGQWFSLDYFGRD
jgi:hypothetical protein